MGQRTIASCTRRQGIGLYDNLCLIVVIYTENRRSNALAKSAAFAAIQINRYLHFVSLPKVICLRHSSVIKIISETISVCFIGQTCDLMLKSYHKQGEDTIAFALLSH